MIDTRMKLDQATLLDETKKGILEPTSVSLSNPPVGHPVINTSTRKIDRYQSIDFRKLVLELLKVNLILCKCKKKIYKKVR